MSTESPTQPSPNITDGNAYLYYIHTVLALQLDQSPAFLTSDDFVKSNEIVRTKWSIY